jgi:hypothetical protein
MKLDLTTDQVRAVKESLFIHPDEVSETALRVTLENALQSSRAAASAYYEELDRVGRLRALMKAWGKRRGTTSQRMVKVLLEAEQVLDGVLGSPDVQVLLGVGENSPLDGPFAYTGKSESLQVNGQPLTFRVVEKVAMPLGSIKGLKEAKRLLHRLALVVDLGPARLSPKLPPGRAVTRPEGRALRELCINLASIFEENAIRDEAKRTSTRGRPTSLFLMRRRAFVKTICSAGGVRLKMTDKALDALMPPVFSRRSTNSD